MQQFFKRCLCFACMMMVYTSLFSQSLKKLEYFFDTDPGAGNGTAINLSSLTTDSTFAFDVSSLTNGLHTIYVRAQDENLNWSLNYSTSFLKTSGSDTALDITRLEYFIDADPGFGNGINIPITPANVINDIFDFTIPDNGADSRRLVIRALDSYGRWSLLYDTTVNLCEIYKARPNFSWVRYADEYSFIDSSINNPTHKLLWNFDGLGIDSVSNPQFTFPIGNHYVTLTAGKGCRSDSIVLPLFTGLEQYFPDTAFNGGDMAMSFFGGGLDTNLVVTLNNNSGTVISPYAKVSSDKRSYTGAFDLHTVPEGIYDIHLHFSNGYDTTITGGLRVFKPANGEAYEPDINISLVGPDVGRPNSRVKIELIVTNNGGMMAKDVPVSYVVGDGAGSGLPHSEQLNYLPPPYPQYDYEDSVPKTLAIDSLYAEPFQGQVNSFIIPYLNSGESFTVPIYFQLPSTHGSYVDVYAWNGERLLGSPLRAKVGACWDDVIDFVVGFVPGFSCANSVYNYFKFGSTSVGNWMWNTFGTVLSCVPGLNDLENLSRAQKILKLLDNPKALESTFQTAASSIYGVETGDCTDTNDPNKKQQKKIKKRYSVDPNQISGPNGYADNNYINGTGRLGYYIQFENKPEATANAQRVYISDTLDKTKFDLATFQLLSYSIGDSVFTIPATRKEFTQTTDLRPSQDLLLRFNAKLDTATGILNYQFLSIDPATRDTLPLSDLRGFLPPDVDNISGLGSVSYSVSAKNNLVTNDVISNKASIVFDNNPAIITNTWINTIDKAAPTGSVSSGTLDDDTTVTIHLSGNDVGAGLNRYRIYMSQNNRPYNLLGTMYGDTLRFSGVADSTYSFYAVPFDSVNNYIPKAPVAEYSVTFSKLLPVHLLSFTAQKNQDDVVTKWEVTDQVNFNHYEIERSTDGLHFIKAGSVAAINNSGLMNYQFTDINAVSIYKNYRTLFYRLKMVDNDGTSRYSRVVKIDLDKLHTVQLYPNPAHNLITLAGVQNYKQLEVTDATGKIIYNTSINAINYSLDISSFTTGVYLVKIKGDDDVQTLKFLKE